MRAYFILSDLILFYGKCWAYYNCQGRFLNKLMDTNHNQTSINMTIILDIIYRLGFSKHNVSETGFLRYRVL
jgi:hypothetical protein